MTHQVPALVLNPYHHGGVAIVRTLGRLGVPVHAMHPDAGTPVARSRYLSGLTEWDVRTQPPEASLRVLARVARRLGGPPVLIVADDNAAAFASAHADALHEHFTFPRRPPGLTERLYRKRGLHELCAEHGVPAPRTRFPRDRDEARELLARAAYPLVLKPDDNQRFARRTGMRMYIARDARDALAAYDRLEDPEAPNLMLQEYLPGPSSMVWVFTGYFDRDCRLVFGAGGVKVRQYPGRTGTTCFGVVRSHPELEALTARFARAVGYRGVFDCGYRLDPRDGRFKLLDVNPRVGQNFRQCVGRGGLDVVRALYLDLTGQPVPADTADEGRGWWVENFDVAGQLHALRDGSVDLRRWLGSLRHVREPAWFARDDVGPFLGMLAGSTVSVRRRLRPPLAHRR